MIWRDAVEAARNGQEGAYEFLYKQTYVKNSYIARKYLKDDEDAVNDVLQDAYVRAFRNLKQLEDTEKFPGWMSSIVTRTALNELKKKKPVLFSQMGEDESDVDFEDTLEDDRVDGSPELSLDTEETKRLVKEMLDTLSDEQRICILMFYMEEKSIREIAEIIGVSENTVKSRLNYGRKAVKEKVLELEKKGTKLYGILPFGFFLYLLKMDASACEVTMASSSASLYQSISEKMSLRANASTHRISQNVVSGGMKAAKISTKTKIFVGVALGVVVCGTGMVGMVKAVKSTTNNASTVGIVSEKDEQDAGFKVPLTDEQMESDYPVVKTEKETPSPKPTPTPEKEDMPADGYRFEYGCLYEGYLINVEAEDNGYLKATWREVRSGKPVTIPRDEVSGYQIGSTHIFEGETFWCSEEDEMYWYFIPEYEDSLESTNMDGDVSFRITKSEFCKKDSTCFMRYAVASDDYGRYYLWEDVGDVVSYLTGEEELIYDRVDGWIYKSGSLKDIYEDESIIGSGYMQDTWREFQLMFIYPNDSSSHGSMVSRIEEQSLCG